MSDKQFAAYVRRLQKNLLDMVEKAKEEDKETLEREIVEIVKELETDIAN
ncbi:MAG: hypothetical protein LBL98_04950 [Ruminococcus sp.]|nr:hypothetical protein [Ruminococcus sp.]